MNPEVAALLEELASDPQTASVTFFPLGVHTHLMSDGQGGWNLQVHSTPETPEEGEMVITDEHNLATVELLMRMSTLADMSEQYLSQMAEKAMRDIEAELEALLGGE